MTNSVRTRYLARMTPNFAHALLLSFVVALGSLSATHAADPIDTTQLTVENHYDFVHSVWSGGGDYQGWTKFSIFFNPSGQWKELRIQNTNTFAYHAQYLSQHRPEFKGLTPKQIDALTLPKANRRALLGTLMIRKLGDGDTWDSVRADFQLLSHDPLEIVEVVAARDWIANASKGYVRKLYYYPAPELREGVRLKLAEYQAAGIDVVLQGDSDSKICYSPNSWSVGQVRILNPAEYEDQFKQGLIAPTDFLVLQEAPREVPPVAGVVTSTTSSPSSHIAILSGMLGFPFFYEKGATQDPKWLARAGKFIFVKSTGGIERCDVSISEPSDLTGPEIERLVALKRPKIEAQPALDPSLDRVTPLTELSEKNGPQVGGKSANLARMTKILPASVLPNAVAIPVSYFLRYLETARTPEGVLLGDFVRASLAKIAPAETPLAQIQAEMAAVRAAFKATPVPQQIVADLLQQLSKFYPDSKVRVKLRSSSNVEDARDFNGAGLYDSAGACIADEGQSGPQSACRPTEAPDPFSKALNKVWRSLYTDRGYLARRWFGIAEQNAAMGVLLHPSFEKEEANGVAIFRRQGQGFELLLTGFPGEDLEVTHPPAGKLPETARVQAFSGAEPGEAEILMASTEIPAGRQLLEPKEYRELFGLMKQVFEKWGVKHPGLALDFEWKVMLSQTGARKLVLKQVRQVPEPNRLVPGARNLTLVGDRGFQLEAFPFESDEGLKALQTNFAVQAKLGAFSFPAQGQPQIPVESLSLEGRLGTYTISPQQAAATATASAWKKETDFEGKEVETRTWDGKIKMPNPEVPSLVLRFVAKETRPAGQLTIDDPVRKISDLDFSYEVSSKDLISLKLKPASSVYVRTLDPRRPQFPEGPAHDASEKYAGGSLGFSAKATTTCSGMCKTTFLDLEKIEIKGVLPQTIVVSAAKAMVYAPAHHNFSWEYALDLFHANGITEAQKQQLVKKGGRYYTLTLGTLGAGNVEAALWSEQGVRKSLGKLTPQH